MVSKNNHQFYQQKHAERKQRWGVRKLSVGVASVLLGTTFMLYGNHAVLADTVTSPSDDVTRSTTTQEGNKDKGTTPTSQTSGETDNVQDKTSTETSTGTDKQASNQNVDPQAPKTNDDSQAKKATGEKPNASTGGKEQKVASPQPAPVQKSVTPTASADYTPATPTTDKAGVTTGVYNNPLVTSSNWIKMTHGDAISYYTAKGKDGKTYVTGYAAANGNSQSIFNVDQIDANSLEFHLIYHNGDKEVGSGLWFNFADGKTLKVDTSRLGSDGIQLKSSQQGQSYKWAIHANSDGGNYYNSWAEYLKAHNNVGDQASAISMTGVALKPGDTIEFVIPVKYTGQLSDRTQSLRFEQDIDDYGSGFNRSSASLYFTTVRKDLSQVKEIDLIPAEFMGEQPGQSNWKLVKEFVKDMPKGRETLKISNFPIFKGSFNTELPKGDLPPVVYGTAQYFIDLSQIQKIFANHGYTVKYANNNGKAQEMPFYGYVTLPLALIDGGGKPVDPSIWTIQVQAVPAIILNKDQHYVADPNAKPWDPTSMIDEIYAADDAGPRKTRDQLEKLPKTAVDISYEYQAPGDATAVAADKVDLTKAGVYTVTYSHTYADGRVVKDSRKVYVYDVKKDITRTIIVHVPKGKNQTVTQKATLTREVIRDATTGEIKSVGEWSTAKWEAYSAPEFKGYTPDKDQVAETTVNENTPDTTVEISYTANKTPEQSDNSKDKDQGQKPQTPDSNENGKHHLSTGENTESSGSTAKPKVLATANKVTKNLPQTGENTESSGSTTKPKAPSTANKVTKNLPQTGKKENQLGLLGIVLASLGVFGLGWKKREHK